jgi:hypothetical protein
MNQFRRGKKIQMVDLIKVEVNKGEGSQFYTNIDRGLFIFRFFRFSLSFSFFSDTFIKDDK